jgi:hypothetical protein
MFESSPPRSLLLGCIGGAKPCKHFSLIPALEGARLSVVSIAVIFKIVCFTPFICGFY